MKTSGAAAATSNILLKQAEYLVPVLAFVVPIFVAGPQWLTGTLVNCFLFLTALKLSRSVQLLVVVLPGIGALLHGVLFGAFTPFLAFFLPFIWLGNLSLMRSFIFLGRMVPSPLAVVLSALVKASLLFLCALVYFRLGWVPKPFLLSMGLVQFFTALAGGWIALSLLRFTDA